MWTFEENYKMNDKNTQNSRHSKINSYLRWNASGNWVIIIFIGQKPCARIISIILHSCLHFSRAINLKSVRKNAIWLKIFWYKVFVHWKLKLLNFLVGSVLITCLFLSKCFNFFIVTIKFIFKYLDPGQKIKNNLLRWRFLYKVIWPASDQMDRILSSQKTARGVGVGGEGRFPHSPPLPSFCLFPLCSPFRSTLDYLDA